jgi:Flp pilus assembly secretin CpaC
LDLRHGRAASLHVLRQVNEMTAKLGRYGCTLRTVAVASTFAGMLIVSVHSQAADIDVVLDRAKLVKLPDRVGTVVVGNPLIADVSVQPGGQIVVTGKGYGSTNLIVLDRAGNVLLEQTIEVQGPIQDVVVVYRGIERESYSCTPTCERRITLGDTQTYFDSTLTQTGTRSSQAQSKDQPR